MARGPRRTADAAAPRGHGLIGRRSVFRDDAAPFHRRVIVAP
jgi:hypothetical protein